MLKCFYVCAVLILKKDKMKLNNIISDLTGMCLSFGFLYFFLGLCQLVDMLVLCGK